MRGAVLGQLKGVRLSLGGAPLFESVDIALARGDRAALVGANGAGKSTLMRILAGLAEPDAGERALANGARLELAEQEPDLSGAIDLRAYASGASAPAYAADAALNAFGLDPERKPAGLSGGETRRASLARVFAADPDILLLDEPTNHLDIPAIEDLETRVRAFRGAVLLVSHDRRFLERVSTAVLWLRNGRVQRLDRPYGAFEDWAAGIEAEEAKALNRLETHLKDEERWLQRGVTARRSRNEGRRRKLLAMRAERADRKALTDGPRAALSAAQGAGSGKLVIEAKGLAKNFAGRAIVSGLSVRILRGDRIGIVGPNGVGKSTLIDLLLKRQEPDAGSVRHGANVEIVYVDQMRTGVKPTSTLWEALAPQGGDQIDVRGQPRHVAAYAKDFLFTPAQLRQPVAALSGGERNRLALAVALARPANVLVLDEPTNDLDMDTLDALADALAAYDGTVLIVSHDRAFLDGVATQTLAGLGDGRWVETPGGFADFEREFGGLARAIPAAPTAGPDRAPVQDRKARKLSFKEEHRLREIEALAPRLDAEIAALEVRLADPGLYGQNPAGFTAATHSLEAARARKDALETEWLEIEERRDALRAEQ